MIEDDITYKAILRFTYEKNRIYPDELSMRLKITRQEIDYRLKRLVLHGYLDKHIDKDDRVYYILTDKGYKLLGVKPKTTKKEIYKVIRYIPLLPIALGLISMGKYIAEADFMRGMTSFILWGIIGLILYILLQKIFGE
jgi:predicted transcriptional regulator